MAGAIFYSIAHFRQEETVQESKMMLLQEPVKNIAKQEQVTTGWVLYRSSQKNVSFRYHALYDSVQENNESIIVHGAYSDPSSDPSSGVRIRVYENDLNLSPRAWWYAQRIKSLQWSELFSTTRKEVVMEDASRLIVATSQSWKNEPFVATYLPCGTHMCEVRSEMKGIYPLDETCRRVLMTLQEWNTPNMGFDINEWEGVYENTLAKYRVRYPINQYGDHARAPERDGDEAYDKDRYVRLPYPAKTDIRALFCAQPGADGVKTSLDNYLLTLSGSVLLERWSVPTESGEWAEAAWVSGKGAVDGIKTYSSSSDISDVPSGIVYVKRDGLILAFSFSSNGVSQQDFFRGAIDSLELLPFPDLKDKTSEGACEMQEMTDGYWKNDYVVMYPGSMRDFGEQSRLQGAYPELFEVLGGGWARQTKNRQIFCKGARVSASYESFHVTDQDHGMAEDEYSQYTCEEGKNVSIQPLKKN